MVATAVTIIAYTSQPITRFFTLASCASVHVMSLEGCVCETRSGLFFSVLATRFEGEVVVLSVSKGEQLGG